MGPEGVPEVAQPVAKDTAPDQAAEATEAFSRGRGRPLNAERGLGAPLLLAHRRVRHRQLHRIVSVDVPGDLADRIRALKTSREATIEKVLTAALDALGNQVV